MIDLKEVNNVVPYSHIKIENLFLLKEMLLLGDFMSNIDLKEAYSAVLLSKSSQKYVRFQQKGLLIGTFMPMLQTFYSTKNFHQINESSNIGALGTFYQYYNISRRYTTDSSFSTGITYCTRYVEIFASELGIFDQHPKFNTGSDIFFEV